MATYKSIGNLAFVGAMFIGMGSGFIFSTVGMPGGLFLGMGAGFALRALLMFIGREREHEMMMRTGQLPSDLHMESSTDPFEQDQYHDDSRTTEL
ncbi:MAG: hypothetical protein AAFR59_16110 [Bacteroidota bacterium]